MQPDSLQQQVAYLRYGEHLCLIYDDRAEQMATAIPFTTGGLAAGDCCVFVAGDQTIGDVATALAEAGQFAHRIVDVNR